MLPETFARIKTIVDNYAAAHEPLIVVDNQMDVPETFPAVQIFDGSIEAGPGSNPFLLYAEETAHVFVLVAKDETWSVAEALMREYTAGLLVALHRGKFRDVTATFGHDSLLKAWVASSHIVIQTETAVSTIPPPAG